MRRLCLALALLGAVPLPGGDFAALCYHRFGPETAKDPYRISLARLGAELDWLKREGWQAVSLSQVAAAAQGSQPLPQKSVLVSVDDGYASGAEAAPLFEAHGIPVTYFVYPSVIGHKGFCSWDQLRDLEHRGHTVASHALTHPNLAKVPKGQSPKAFVAWVDQELRGSRERLEKELGHPVQDLAWPYGAYNNVVLEAAKAAGYRRCYTVNGVLADPAALDPFRLPRLLFMGTPSLEAFARRFVPSRTLAPTDGIEEGALIFDDQKAPAGRGFHFLEKGADRLLYQVAPAAWRPHFKALASSVQH